MIPRTLVPVNLRPVRPDEVKNHGHRLETYMDDRTVVPSGLSDAPPLDGKTNIPAHLPLGVLVDRTLVPRGMPAKPIERLEPMRESAVSIAVLDSRVVVPAYVEPADAEEQLEFEHAPEMTDQLREVIEPDIFMTGDANLLMEAKDKRDPKSDLLTRVLSVLVHIGLIIFLIFTPKIFPPHVPTQQEIDLAKQQLRWIYTPPDLPKTAPPPSPKIHITAKTLNKISPKIEEPVIHAPPANPEKPPTDLPEAPKPQAVAPRPVQPAPQTPAPSQLEPVEPLRPNPQSNLNLHLNDDSPGKQIEDQIQDAIKHGNRGGVYPGDQTPPGTGRGGPGMGGSAQILSDTQGVDFSSYIQRLLATLQRNWEAVMPESAMMGDRGITATIFKIAPDGSVIPPDPTLERTSGKEPLDNAAMSAIHASNPFEPLPPQFHGPYLELRIWFLYNIPRDQWPNSR
jgi:hypothetical protein